MPSWVHLIIRPIAFPPRDRLMLPVPKPSLDIRWIVMYVHTYVRSTWLALCAQVRLAVDVAAGFIAYTLLKSTAARRFIRFVQPHRKIRACTCSTFYTWPSFRHLTQFHLARPTAIRASISARCGGWPLADSLASHRDRWVDESPVIYASQRARSLKIPAHPKADSIFLFFSLCN